VALKASELDTMSLEPLQHLRQTKGRRFTKKFDKHLYFSPGYTYIGWNNAHPIFRDKRVRQAMTYLTNRKQMVKTILNVPRSDIPAVTHVDYSARVQTVHKETNPRYHALISSFKARTGCPMVVNTSFNVRGEPIVQTPEDAFRCFMGCEMETLVVGNCILDKRDQDPALKIDYKDEFELD
jgi:ABC-type transport system substrate-binding protein